MKHGEPSSYWYYKCRCGLCRAAASRYRKQRRLLHHAQHRVAPELTPHGKISGYQEYGCRCTPCRTVYAAKAARWREKR